VIICPRGAVFEISGGSLSACVPQGIEIIFKEKDPLQVRVNLRECRLGEGEEDDNYSSALQLRKMTLFRHLPDSIIRDPRLIILE